MRPASSTPRARPFATTGMPTTRPTAARCPMTAAKWIAEHGSLDGVIAAAGSFKGVAGDNLRKALDWLPQGKRLVTVMTDCDLTGHVMDWPEFESLALREVDRDGLLDFYNRFGFKALKRELENQMAGGAEGAPRERFAEPVIGVSVPVDKRYETVLSMPQLEGWLRKIEAAPLVAIDTETDSLDPMTARILGISLSVAVGEAAYIPLRHSYAGAPDQLAFDDVMARLKPWLENPDAGKLGQNIKYDGHVFANAGIQVRGYLHDTLLQSYVLEAHRPHSLDSLVQRHLGRKGL